MAYCTKLNLMVPTKGRANTRLPHFIKSAQDTVRSKSNICFTFCVSADDTETAECIKAMCDGWEYKIITESIGKCHLGKFFNMMWEATKSLGPTVACSMLGDDMVFITKGWDAMVIEKLNDTCGMGIVYGDDDYTQHDKLCVNMFVMPRLIRATGKPFMCEMFAVDWIDVIWYKLGEKLNLLEYMPNVHIQHRHSTEPAVGMDKTTADMRKGLRENAPYMDRLADYVEELAKNVRLDLDAIVEAGDDLVAMMMTTYDRTYLLSKTVKSYNASVVLPKHIAVFDDGSVRAEHVGKIAAHMTGAIFTTATHVRCEKNHRRAFSSIVEQGQRPWLGIVDSDTLLYKFWYIRAVDALMEFNAMDRVAMVSFFNKGDNYADEQPFPDYVCRTTAGGLGMFVRLSTVMEYLGTTSPSEGHEGWDNTITRQVLKAGKLIVATKRSYVQHSGFVDGVHGNYDHMSSVAKNFCGNIQEQTEDASERLKAGDRVLYSCMAYKKDIVAAAAAAYSIMEHGIILRWLVIPHNVGLVETLCPGLPTKVIEPYSGNPFDTFCETISYKMKEMYPGFVGYVNAQISSRELHFIFRNSGADEIAWLTKRLTRTMDVAITESGLSAMRSRLQVRTGTEDPFHHDGKKVALVTLCCENEAVDYELGNLLIGRYVAEGYDVWLVSDLRVSEIKHMRQQQLYRLADRQVVNLVRWADVVDGQTSWVTLLARVIGNLRMQDNV